MGAIAVRGFSWSERHGARWLAPRATLLLALLVTLVAGLSFAPGALAVEGDSISGTVTDALTHSEIKGIEVCAYSSIEEGFSPPPCVDTEAGGNYTLAGLSSGQYKVEFSAPGKSNLNYITQYYNGTPSGTSSFSGALPVTVSEATGASGIDAALKAGGRITGRVTSAATSAPVEGIMVCAMRGQFEGGGCVSTNSSGEYTISSLASGSYTVEFTTQFESSLNYITQYYNGATSLFGASQVVVNAPEITSGINAALQVGGQISGTVIDASTNAAMKGVLVCAFAASPEVIGCAATDQVGHYLISGLASADYQVRFSAGKGYLVQYYNARYTRAEAQVVPLFAGELKSGINAAMQTAPATLPVNTGAPAVSGTPTVGQELSCSTGSWSGKPPPTLTYQWLRDGAPIIGATETAYQTGGHDVGHTISCEVTAPNVVGKATATSAGVAISPVAPLVTIVSRGLVVKGHSLDVKASCGRAPCKGSIELVLRVTVKHGKGKKGRTSTKTLVLAKGSFSLAPGGERSVVLRLTAQGNRTLAHARRHPVEARLVASVKGGNTVSKSVLVK